MMFLKMSDLVDFNNESYKIKELLKQQVSDFRLRFEDSDFTISYDFDGGIRVLAPSFDEWSEELHELLCEEFGVKLVDMTRTEVYTRRVRNVNLMFHYLPVDCLEDALEWGELV